MFILIKNYVDKMTIEDVKNFAIKNNIFLSDKELDFTFSFIKRNYEALYANPNTLIASFAIVSFTSFILDLYSLKLLLSIPSSI